MYRQYISPVLRVQYSLHETTCSASPLCASFDQEDSAMYVAVLEARVYVTNRGMGSDSVNRVTCPIRTPDKVMK
jgi:hypothetical protein